jgi:hypothetical protein
MSFSLMEVARLQVFGGAVLARYRELVEAADRSLHDSPAQRELGEFRQSWLADPNATAEVARELMVARAEAAELAAHAT